MPRLYLTPGELAEMPLGIGLQSSLNQLGAGVLDKLLFRASQRCDSFCQKRLGAPQTTTLAANVSAGATSISVASTLGWDNLAEQAVILNPGGATQETILIQPGGVTITPTAGVVVAPYPGTLTLATGCVYGHSTGETIQGCYMEVTEAGSSSSSDPYTESLQTQAMQLALAHLPPARTALTRVIFLKNYPIISIQNIEHAFSFVNQFNKIDLSIETIVPTEGWYRFNVGTVILREGIMRTTYTGGYQTVPDDIKEACSYFVADEMERMSNPFGAISLTLGKKSQRWEAKGADLAEERLLPYKRTM